MRRVTRTDTRLIDPERTTGPEDPSTSSYLNRRFFRFDRKLAYPETTDTGEWQRWHRKLRRALYKTLCLDRLGAVPTPTSRVLETVQCEGYRREKLAYEVLPGDWVSAYLLIPDGKERGPAVICPHGHVEGAKENVVGIARPKGVAYAHEFARRGLVALAPDNAGMGERGLGKNQKGHLPVSGCYLMWARLNQMGLDLTGFRVFELMAGINLLVQRPEVDTRRIGCAGLSGGCWLSQVLTALDRRIKAVILSGFFTTFVQTVWHGHCICHHPFGIGLVCDLPDLSALIAPRPQFVESGVSDARYPHEPAYSIAKRAYRFLGVGERLELHRYKGGHMFNGKKSIPWMLEQLGG